MATVSEITKLYTQYMGFTPSSEDIKRLSMMRTADVADILKDTKSDVQSTATTEAQSAITSLMSGLPEGAPGYVSEYLTSLAEGRKKLEEQYGLTEAEKRMKEAEKFYRETALKGPMFEPAMRAGLEEVSPTFLGTTRKDLEGQFAGIPNPFVRERMINAYLTSADRSMTATLNALNGLYQTSVLAAQTAVEAERNQYNRIADKVSDLYSDLQWVNRNRYAEQSQLRLEEEMKRRGLGAYYRPEEVEITMTYEEWIDAIKGGWVKLGDITNTSQLERVTKLLSSRDIAIEDDKSRVDLQLKHDVSPEQLIQQVWTSFNNNEISAEEAEELVSYIQNKSIEVEAKKLGPAPTPEMYGEAFKETLKGRKLIPWLYKAGGKITEFGRGLIGR